MIESDVEIDDDMAQADEYKAEGDDADDDREIPQPEDIPEPLVRRQQRHAPDVSLYDLQVQDETYQIRMDSMQLQLIDQTISLGRMKDLMISMDFRQEMIKD